MENIITNSPLAAEDAANVRAEVRSLIDNAMKLGILNITAEFLLTPRGWETFAAIADEIERRNFQMYEIKSRDGAECHVGIFLK